MCYVKTYKQSLRCDITFSFYSETCFLIKHVFLAYSQCGDKSQSRKWPQIYWHWTFCLKWFKSAWIPYKAHLKYLNRASKYFWFNLKEKVVSSMKP